MERNVLNKVKYERARILEEGEGVRKRRSIKVVRDTKHWGREGDKNMGPLSEGRVKCDCSKRRRIGHGRKR